MCCVQCVAAQPNRKHMAIDIERTTIFLVCMYFSFSVLSACACACAQADSLVVLVLVLSISDDEYTTTLVGEAVDIKN